MAAVDESVARAMARWPDVPSVFGWLSLDRRGRWLLKGERIDNRSVWAFIGRNYAADDRGRWYFQNGPQRVFVALEATPWVLRLHADGCLTTHTGADARKVHAAFMDEQGNVVLDTTLGAGLLDDRDLDVFSDHLRDGGGEKMSEDLLIEAVEHLFAAVPVDIQVVLHGACVPLRFIAQGEVPARLGFVRDPQPDDKDP